MGFWCMGCSHCAMLCVREQLRERLSLLKVAEAEEEEKKRKEILSAKLVSLCE